MPKETVLATYHKPEDPTYQVQVVRRQWKSYNADRRLTRNEAFDVFVKRPGNTFWSIEVVGFPNEAQAVDRAVALCTGQLK